MNWPESFHAHPNDHSWWYRLLRSFWIAGLTMTAIFSFILMLWWLTEHGDLSPDELETLSIRFGVVGWSVVAGFGIAGINLVGPHRFQTIVHNSLYRALGILRGWYHAE